MAEYRFEGETTDLIATVPDENQVDEEVPEWAKRIVDAWLHGKLLDFKGCTVPKGIQEILYRHFWAKHKLGVCTSCMDKDSGPDLPKEVNNEATPDCDVSCTGTDCLHQREHRNLEPEAS